MKHNKHLKTVFAIALAILAFSCQNEIEDPPPPPVTLSEALASESDGQIVLGKPLENPYAVKNMRKAYTSLMEKHKKSKKTYAAKILEDSTAIETTDYYVKFWVENDEQRNLLLADSLNLSMKSRCLETLGCRLLRP